MIPACIVRPHDVQQHCTAVTVLKREYHERKQARKAGAEGLFAIRSGGRSPVSGAASIKGGVVTPSEGWIKRGHPGTNSAVGLVA